MYEKRSIFVCALVLFTIFNIRDGFAQNIGIWSSVSELSNKQSSGPAWEAVLGGAKENTSSPSLSNQDDHTGVHVLAKAIVYVKTGDEKYKNEAIQSIEKLVANGRPSGRTLAWGRNICGYVAAADLLNYHNSAFKDYCRHLVTDWQGSQLNRNLREMVEFMPNNWGTLASGSVAAIYLYLGETANFEAFWSYWRDSVTGVLPDGGRSWGGDNSWHADESHLTQVNPKGAEKSGPGSPGDPLWQANGKLNIDGILTTEMRRGGSLKGNPNKTGYAWEGLQGLIVAARIFARQGKPAWDIGDKALYRAAYALQERLKWKATSGNDGWLLVFLDDAYGTNWSSSLNGSTKWGRGRGAGWGYVLGGDVGGNQSTSITGEVKNASNGDAISDATVQLKEGEAIRYETRSTSSGWFGFNNIQEGTYELKGTKDGFDTWSNVVTVANNETVGGQAIQLNPVGDVEAPSPPQNVKVTKD